MKVMTIDALNGLRGRRGLRAIDPNRPQTIVDALDRASTDLTDAFIGAYAEMARTQRIPQPVDRVITEMQDAFQRSAIALIAEINGLIQENRPVPPTMVAAAQTLVDSMDGLRRRIQSTVTAYRPGAVAVSWVLGAVGILGLGALGWVLSRSRK